MIELTNLIITWLISVAMAFGIGYFYAQKKEPNKKSAEHERVEPSAEQVYEREKRAQEERNFWSYDGSEQSDSTAL